MALARALTADGTIAVIDEPTESFDAEGCAAVHTVLGDLARQGRTIVIMSHDGVGVKREHTVLDLSTKPVPTIRQVGGDVVAKQVQPDSQSSAPGEQTKAPISTPAKSKTATSIKAPNEAEGIESGKVSLPSISKGDYGHHE